MTSRIHALRGGTLTFKADPFLVGPAEAFSHETDGLVVIRDGVIEAVGPAAEMLARYPGVAVDHYPGHLLMAGFVDAHAHYPQTTIIASYGAQLFEWLNKYTFPAELAFADAAHAARMADLYLDECLRNGTTTASVYCTVHPVSVDVFFAAAERRGMRMIAGKVMMDRNAPPGLLDTAHSAYDESKALIGKWHKRGRLGYAISPRFAPTSTQAQLEAAGALWAEHPDTLLQTHYAENVREVAWVRELFPDALDYLDVYDRAGLLGPGANLGHAVHLSDRERARLRESGAGLSHCPTSNAFIGSGLFDLAGLAAAPSSIPIGLATDVGGGSSFSMLQTMRSAYEIAQLRGRSLHPVEAFYLATLGSARVLRLDRSIGNLAAGFEADIVVIDPRSRPLIAERVACAGSIADVLFAQMILADDRAIKS
ncbi:MAG: guanine deaminase, partial [Hyphomicrobiaceae bacterium]